jgi:TRAP transporter TAXI family solute receptor
MGHEAQHSPAFRLARPFILSAALILSLPVLSPGVAPAQAQYIPPPAAQTFAPAGPVAIEAAPQAEETPRASRRATRRHRGQSAASAAEETPEKVTPAPTRRSRATSRRQRRQEARAAAAAKAAEAKAAAIEARAAALEAKAQAKADKPDTSSVARPDSASSEIVVLAGEQQTTNARSAAEIASLVQGAGVTLRPELGKISIDQLTSPDGGNDADLAILQSDALDDARRAAGPELARKLSFVARLYNQEIHVVARAAIGSFTDLAGKKVAIGSPDSPGGRTAVLLFERAGVKPQTVIADQKAALDKLGRGEVEAAVFVGGKPVPALADLTVGGLHLVSIPYKGALQEFYYPAQITAGDYPGLVTPGANVDTVAIGTVLVALDARPGSQRYKNLSKFTEAFFDGFAGLRDAAHHPKWREVNLAADVPGWRRFMPAQKWLDRAPALRDQRTTDAVKKADPPPQQRLDDFKSFVDSRPDLGKMSSPDQEKMFKEFLQWNKEHGK